MIQWCNVCDKNDDTDCRHTKGTSDREIKKAGIMPKFKYPSTKPPTKFKMPVWNENRGLMFDEKNKTLTNGCIIEIIDNTKGYQDIRSLSDNEVSLLFNQIEIMKKKCKYPVDFFDFEESEFSSDKNEEYYHGFVCGLTHKRRIKTWIFKVWYDYFNRKYKDIQFYISDNPEKLIIIKQHSRIIGAIMPCRHISPFDKTDKINWKEIK